MLPAQLTAGAFTAYPKEAKAFAAERLELLRRLPLGFAPLLLRELLVYDYKFPMERVDLERQFRFLASLSPEAFAAHLEGFARLKLPKSLEEVDWVNNPAVFSEQLTAHLWNTHQIDAFRAAAVQWVKQATAAFPDEPIPARRLGIAVIGQGVGTNDYRLFRKLRPEGTYFTNVRGGLPSLMEALAKRAGAQPGPYRHWYIDGGTPAALGSGGDGAVTRVSWAGLAAARAALQIRMQKTYEASVFDPEAFRTMMAQIKPAEIGLDAAQAGNQAGDEAINRFQMSLLTEGSGTQVFSTTFVQWATREALRRAQPLTLLARFAPRQREKQMNELLAENSKRPDLDPQGSLVDADMGAYYHWLNQQRLAGAEQSGFLAWFENHGEAVAVGQGFAKAKTAEAPVELENLVARLGAM
jgi:hypothetical protein